MKPVKWLAIASLLALLAPTAPVSAQVTTPNNLLPPDRGFYGTLPGTFITYVGSPQLVITNVRHYRFMPNYTPPTTPGVPTPEPFTSLIDFDVSTDGGLTFVPLVGLPALVNVQVTLTGTVGDTRTFSTEMTQLDITGPGGLRLRESPTLASLGTTTITGTGPYTINSFFDIFTELSVDGGATFAPATTVKPVFLRDIPEPSTMLLLGFGVAGLAPMALRRRRQPV